MVPILWPRQWSDKVGAYNCPWHYREPCRLGWWLGLNFRHTSHLSTYALASSCIHYLQYRAASRAIVFWLPSWPAAGKSLFSCKSVSLSSSGTHSFQATISSFPITHGICLYSVSPSNTSLGTYSAAPLSSHACPWSSCTLYSKQTFSLSEGFPALAV